MFISYKTTVAVEWWGFLFSRTMIKYGVVNYLWERGSSFKFKIKKLFIYNIFLINIWATKLKIALENKIYIDRNDQYTDR
jgi:hypothetical protein